MLFNGHCLVHNIIDEFDWIHFEGRNVAELKKISISIQLQSHLQVEKTITSLLKRVESHFNFICKTIAVGRKDPRCNWGKASPVSHTRRPGCLIGPIVPATIV